MAATVHFLHPPTAAVGYFLRLGHTGHRMLETLLAAGRVSIDRAVVDAAHLDEQGELLDVLREVAVQNQY